MSPVAAITAAAKAAGISVQLLLAVCTVETGLRQVINFNDGGSPSHGICQVKLSTAQMFNEKVRASFLVTNEGSALYAARYLRFQLDRYEGDVSRAVSAFNAGSAIRGNQRYVNKVMIKRVEASL